MEHQRYIPKINHPLFKAIALKITTLLKPTHPYLKRNIPDHVPVPAILIVLLITLTIAATLIKSISPAYSFFRRITGRPSIRDPLTSDCRMLTASFLIYHLGYYAMIQSILVVDCMETCMQECCEIVSNVESNSPSQ